MNIHNTKQDYSYQGEALNVPSAFKGLWSSNNIKIINKLNVIKNEFFFLNLKSFL